MGYEIGQGHQGRENTNADPESKTKTAADDCQKSRLGKELAKNVSASCAHGLAHADFPGAFRHRDEHDVHHSDAAQAKRYDRDTAEEEGDKVEDAGQDLGAVHRVP